MFKHSGSDRSRILKGILERLPASNRVLHALRSPSVGAPIDHIVVSPCGIFAIDVVRAKGTVKARRDTLWLGDKDLIDACISTQRKAGEVGKYLRHAVTPVLCFVHATLPAPVIHLRHVIVCTPDILPQYINGGPRCLDARSVQLFSDRVATLGRDRSAAAATPVPFPPPGIKPLRRSSRTGADSSVTSSATSSSRTSSPASSPAPRHRRFFSHQIIGTAIGTAVCILGAWAVPVLAHLTDEGVDQFVQATEHSKSTGALTEAPTTTVAPAVVPAEIPAETAEGAATPPPPAPETAPPQPDLLPTLDFTCPVAGQGWTASPVATIFESDPVGFYLWRATSADQWEFWVSSSPASSRPPELREFNRASHWTFGWIEHFIRTPRGRRRC